MASRTNPPPVPYRALALLTVALLATAGCTSGGREPPGQTTGSTQGAPAPAPSVKVKLVTSAKVPEGGLNPKQAARRAAPGIERFLDRYLTVAFVDAAGGPQSWDGLLGLFDQPVRGTAHKQLDALSLGGASRGVSAVRPDRASGRAVVLYGGRRPASATVRLAFDGTADTAQGSGPVRLRSVLQLLLTSDGWRIAAFDSRTGPAK